MAPDCVPKSFKKYKYMKWEKLLGEERKTAELYAHIVKTYKGAYVETMPCLGWLALLYVP